MAAFGEGSDGVYGMGPCLIRKERGAPELCPRRELLMQCRPHTSEKPELRNWELHQRPGATSQRTLQTLGKRLVNIVILCSTSESLLRLFVGGNPGKSSFQARDSVMKYS